MCGLVGLITKWNTGVFSKDNSMFKDMLFLDTLRGDDGTGVCIVNIESGATVLKESTDYPSFQYRKEFIQELQHGITDAKALLGHNRKATVGAHVDENAHPFVYDDRYVFFHNGTLTNHKQFGNTDVDSDAFGQAITACEGDTAKLSEVFTKAIGAWACVWYDSQKHTVYFKRNKERPLHFIFTEAGNILYSSEAWMAQVAATRNGEKVKATKALDEWTLYSIDLSVSGDLIIKEEKLEKKVYPVQVSTPGSHRKHKNTGATDKVSLSKHEARDLIAELKFKPWVGFFVTDAQCQAAEVDTIDTANRFDCYDWILFGTNPNTPGVLYSGVLQNSFPYEVGKLISEKGYVHGYFTDAVYEKGKVEVWMDEVYNTVSYVC